MNFFQHIKKLLFSFKKQSIIVDTSALHSSQAIPIIQRASKVILLTGTINEMDKQKWRKDQLGANIRALSSLSRKDTSASKFICVHGYDTNNYQDKNIIDYCVTHKGIAILTMDNNLCNMAKAYNIPYFYPEEQIVSSEKNLENTTRIEGILFESGNLVLVRSQQRNPNFLYRRGTFINKGYEHFLEVGDIIFHISKKYGEESYITKYEIVAIQKFNYALKVGETPITKETISVFPSELKRYLENHGYVSNSDTENVNYIQLLPNFIKINLKGRWYIKLERDSTLIPISEYKEGDILYLFIYRNHSFKIKIFEIVLFFGELKPVHRKTYEIDFLNEVYSLHFTEEILEEFKKFYLKSFSLQ